MTRNNRISDRKVVCSRGVCSVCMEGKGTGERYEIRLGFHAVSRCARLGLS